MPDKFINLKIFLQVLIQMKRSIFFLRLPSSQSFFSLGHSKTDVMFLTSGKENLIEQTFVPAITHP
ncbi:hypothetical protein LEP1GSC199_2583 [Leptospira vanthielii serovar Holland str. Waz Holland = ATCC 700522]|uniref:Uncharacterized protein n=1 Tax=Leptospira vanthielii serovar Holland str. Waz Holland = ATCC 700522 TaxID=1218591 RepID=N1WDU8_9LEPT|nr:hypothetical protein LEP1GSC199_2583 [Leptospira vanthielii serovar Holland str. Waz Holland = ATCC 700522]